MKSNPHNHTCHACTYTMLPPQGPRTGLTLDGPDKHGWHVLRLDGSPVADLDPHESAALAELLSQVAQDLPPELPLMQVDHAQPVPSSPDSGESRSRAAGPKSEHADRRRAGAPPPGASSYACERATRVAPATSGKRWTVAGDGSWGNPEHLLWPDDQDPDLPHRFTASHMAEAWPGQTDSIVDPAYAALIGDVKAAAHIRSMSTTLDGWPDRSDMVHAVARTVNAADNEWANAPRTEPHEPWDIYVARAVLAVMTP